jgi:serine O-acetyltransferase
MAVHNSFSKMVVSDVNREIMNTAREFPKNKTGYFFTISRYLLGSKGFRSIFLYRLFNIKFQNLSSLYSILRMISFSIEIPCTTQIDEGFFIGHAEGLLINPNCTIGKNFTIYQGVTLGGNIGKIRDGRVAPLIGDNVFIGPGAKVLGPVTVGDNSMIGANAVVMKDIPKDSLAVGIPSKIVRTIEEPYIEIEKRFKQYLEKQ